MRTLLIRAHAGTNTGTGHVLRCLALAQAWQDARGTVIFAVTSGAEPLLPRLQSEGMEIAMLATAPGSCEDGRATAALARKHAAAWVAVDGYCFGAVYQRIIKDANLPLLVVDDNGHAGEYCGDVVLNQNLHACEAMYAKREPHTKLLLGPRHVLLRREFSAWRNGGRQFPDHAGKVLVTLGGADPENVTAKVLDALEHCEIPSLEVKVAIGPANPNLPALRLRAGKSGGRIALVAAEREMPELMAWADVAVAGAGSTSWELCFLGVPSLLIVLAPNQQPIAEALHARRAAVSLGASECLSPQAVSTQLCRVLGNRLWRMELSERAQSVVSEEGASGLVTQMHGPVLDLRRARWDDCKLLWEWANDPETRASSFSSAPIPWEQHVAWFQRKLADSGCFLFLAFDAGAAPVGQIRFDLNAEGDAVVDVSVAPQHRGRGLGHHLIRLGLEQIFSTATVRRVHAHVKMDNNHSRRAFERAGFRKVDSGECHGVWTLHYLKEAENQRND